MLAQVFHELASAHLSSLIPHPIPWATWVLTPMDQLQFLS